jgi:hypothetical protein
VQYCTSSVVYLCLVPKRRGNCPVLHTVLHATEPNPTGHAPCSIRTHPSSTGTVFNLPLFCGQREIQRARKVQIMEYLRDLFIVFLFVPAFTWWFLSGSVRFVSKTKVWHLREVCCIYTRSCLKSNTLIPVTERDNSFNLRDRCVCDFTARKNVEDLITVEERLRIETNSNKKKVCTHS